MVIAGIRSSNAADSRGRSSKTAMKPKVILCNTLRHCGCDPKVSARNYRKLSSKNNPESLSEAELIQNYLDIRRRLHESGWQSPREIVKQERRLGVYNLFWLVLSKYLVNLLKR